MVFGFFWFCFLGGFVEILRVILFDISKIFKEKRKEVVFFGVYWFVIYEGNLYYGLEDVIFYFVGSIVFLNLVVEILVEVFGFVFFYGIVEVWFVVFFGRS